MTRKRLDEVLRNLGFARTKEVFIAPYGKYFWEIYSYDYEVEVEPNPKESHFSNEGVEKVLEIGFSVDGTEICYYAEVYRVVRWELYIIHVFTGFEEEYFAVYVFDKQKIETIAKLELNGGHIFVGSQKDLETLLPKLIRALDPVSIKVY
jgi:hypothetical protein